MDCRRIRRLAAGCVGLLLCGAALGADEEAKPAKKVSFVPTNFYSTYLVPRVDSSLQGESVAASDYVNPAANPWTKDKELVHRVELGAVSAGKRAVKRYLIDSMRLDRLSIPLYDTNKPSLPGYSGDSRARLRFGISHLAPRAELLIPATYGRVALSANARGEMGAMYESHSYNFRVDVAFDPREHTAMFTLGRRF
jgi:hypothetical protein